MLNKTLFTAATLALGLAAAGSSATAQTAEVQSVKVSVAGLNPTSEAGATVILRRIHSAAVKICGPAPSNPMDRLTKHEPCVREIVDRTVASLNNPAVTALNSGAPTTRLASAR